MSVYKGKLAVVTGSAVGIGAAIVDKFIKGGLKVSQSVSVHILCRTCFISGCRSGYPQEACDREC